MVISLSILGIVSDRMAAIASSPSMTDSLLELIVGPPITKNPLKTLRLTCFLRLECMALFADGSAPMQNFVTEFLLRVTKALPESSIAEIDMFICRQLVDHNR
jgi:hypothetical protein